MRARAITFGLTLAALGTSAACTTTIGATEVIVVVRGDDVVARTTTRLEVTVMGAASSSAEEPTHAMPVFVPPWGPSGTSRRIAIVPLRDDATRTFSIEVHAMAPRAGGAQDTLSIARARSGFLPHRSVELSLLLVAGCSCPEEETCDEDGRCVSAHMLPSLDAGLTMRMPRDAGPPPDAGSDAGSDAGPPAPCTGTAACEDGNVCTVADRCVADMCMPGPRSTDCPDGDPCNGEETCVDFVGCEPGVPLDCNDGIVCTMDTCGPTGCAHAPVDALCTERSGGVCSAMTGCSYTMMGCLGCTSDACRTATCTAGVCTFASACGDSNECTDDVCISGACEHLDRTGMCDDGNACTTGDACALGSCSGSPMMCMDDGNSCTAEVCSAGGCSSFVVMEGLVCTSTSTDACITRAECRAGVCTPVSRRTCGVAFFCDPDTGVCQPR